MAEQRKKKQPMTAKQMLVSIIIGFVAVAFVGSFFVNTMRWDTQIMSSGIFRYVRNYSKLDRVAFHEKVRQTRGEIVFFKEGLTCTVTIFRTTTSLCLSGQWQA